VYVAALAIAATSCGGSVASSPADGGIPEGPKCTATLTQLIDARDLWPPDAGGVSAAMDLAVSDTDLYAALSYGQDGALLRVPMRGGPAVVMAPIQGEEVGLLVTGDNVVFVQANQRVLAWDIVRMGLQGGPITVLASVSADAVLDPLPSPLLATDGQNVYFAAPDGTKSVPLAGGAVQTLTTHTGGVAVVGSNVVIADTAAESVFSVPTVGGTETILAANLTGDLGPIVSCGAAVCWVSAVPVGASQQGTGQLVQLGPTGAPVTLSQGPGLYAMYGLLFDGAEFFATAIGDASPGSVERIAGTGGTPTYLGTGSGVAVDDECLYTGDPVSGVYSVAKSSLAASP